MQRCWVTGGNGFLGSRVVRQLAAQGHEVHCLVRSQAAARSLTASLPAADAERVKFVSGSLGDLEACRALVRTGPIGYHIASSLSGSAAALFSANVVAMRILLRAIREQEHKRFVLVSSMAVYGTDHLPKGAVLDETCPLDPAPHLRDPYAFSKIAQEEVCWSARKEWQLPLTVVRPGIIYGPSREFLSTRVGLKVGPLLVRMGGRQPLPYTYVDNCAEAVMLAGIVEGIEGEAFNVVDDVLPTGRQLVREQRRQVGPVPSVTLPLWMVAPLSRWYTSYAIYSQGQLPPILTPYRASALWNSLQYSNAKAKTRLNWSIRVPLDEGLRMTLQSQKSAAG